MPPAHGKTIVISALAAILTMPNHDTQVVVITANEFLNFYAYQNYAYAGATRNTGLGESQIVYMSFKEFIDMDKEMLVNTTFKRRIILFDEVDMIVSETLVNVKEVQKADKKPVITSYSTDDLDKDIPCKKVKALTAS